ncbi:hypothetical protein B0H14DRAFT_3490421 [Mycena olivaceomarginata]|nr:hypothetical protein B0H14DRAFT_3490421 [Mycena olivaceomarginata]
MHGSSSHHLFISAFMIVSKVICDNTYLNKLWSIVVQGMFTLREINQMEHEIDTDEAISSATTTHHTPSIVQELSVADDAGYN